MSEYVDDLVRIVVLAPILFVVAAFLMSYDSSKDGKR